MGLHVLHVDNHLLVLRKPAGLPIVPDSSGDESLLELARAWVAREFQKPGRAFLGVVHRLDRPVSGVCVFGRTSKAARRLTEAFKKREVDKLYWGISDRVPDPADGVLEQWLLKDRSTNRVRVVGAPGQEAKAGCKEPEARLARTRFRVLESAGRGADRRVLLELVPETGRSHQLRVAAASLGAPLMGDLKYGADRPLAEKSVALHALVLELDHPTRRERLRFVAEPPAGGLWHFPRTRPPCFDRPREAPDQSGEE